VFKVDIIYAFSMRRQSAFSFIEVCVALLLLSMSVLLLNRLLIQNQYYWALIARDD
jgi:Tfp pilus assembly protein PilV